MDAGLILSEPTEHCAKPAVCFAGRPVRPSQTDRLVYRNPIDSHGTATTTASATASAAR
jgi:hypothetical protein